MWLVIGAVLGALAVLLGAFGAHALPRLLGSVAEDKVEFQRRVDVFETAARYHMYHALAILAVGILGVVMERSGHSNVCLLIAGIAFLLGIAIFSGCLYAIALTGLNWLGAIVPVGGVSFVIGWIALAIASWGVSTNVE